jgi:hypothetical protein
MSKRGRDRIDRLIAEGKLELVAPSEQVAGRLLDDAEAHIRLATQGFADDLPEPSNSEMTQPARRRSRSSPSKASALRRAAGTSL